MVVVKNVVRVSPELSVKYLVDIGLSTAWPLLLSHVQSPGNGSPFVVICALISGAAAGAGVAPGDSCPTADELKPGVLPDGLAEGLAVAVTAPATSSFSAAFIAAVSLLSASRAARAAFTSFSSSFTRFTKASIF
jgi:hypothetical protein